MSNTFDAKRETELLEVEEHFFCQACLTVLPLSDQSTSLDYCHDCTKLILEERKIIHRKEFWCRDDTVFVTNGKGWVVGPDYQSYCIGPVDAKGYPQDSPPEPPITSHRTQQGVSKITHKESVKAQIVTPIYETKKCRGRPPKKGKVSRVTAWRRRQEGLQATLL